MQQSPVITTQDALEKLITQLEKSPYIAVDTEFHRERTYYPILCLVQLATDDTIGAVDPLAEGLSLKPLCDLLLRKNIVKVFHAGRQDLEIFQHLCGDVPTPVFDTQLAAMALGLGDQLSYAALVQKMLNQRLSKSHQMADWTRRPLGKEQLEYALDDVRYLREVYHKMVDALKARGRESWADDLHEKLLSPEAIEGRTDDLWRGIKIRDRHPRTLTLLRELAIWRDAQARKQDLPRSYVLKDDGMAALAQRKPKNIQGLEEIRVLPNSFVSRHGEAILAITKKVAEMKPDDLLNLPDKRPDNTPESLTTAFASLLLKHRACEADVTPRLLAGSDEMERFLCGDKNVSLAQGWRYDLVGREIEDLAQGKLALKLKDGKLDIVKI